MTMKKIIGAICVLLTCGLLVAGLWPFNAFPRNDVSWLRNRNGLRFGSDGSVFSIQRFELPRSNQESFCSLEILLGPAHGYVKTAVTILAFYNPDNALQFRLMQDRGDFVVTGNYRDQQEHLKTAEVRIELAIRQGQQALFTITSGPKGTEVYRNGVFVDSSSRFALSCKNFSGQLVVGTSPVDYDTWQGELLGLAIYEQRLTPELISRHYETWIQNPRLEGFQSNRLFALYCFGERSGRIIRNSAGSEPNLYIPETFKILHKKILTPPWKEFSFDLGYLLDIIINVGGFVPFGLFVCAYLMWDRPWIRAASLTILLGGIISLMIEILQGFIPSRTSGITDIITNTLGTGLGVLLWRWKFVQALTTKLRGAIRLGATERSDNTTAT